VAKTKYYIKYAETVMLDMNDNELQVYSIELEKELDIPENAHKFLEAIKKSDGIVLSLAEHNGAYTTAFKNLFDWMSRIESKTFFGKPMLLLATAPGGRGGASVLETAQRRLPFHASKVKEVFY